MKEFGRQVLSAAAAANHSRIPLVRAIFFGSTRADERGPFPMATGYSVGMSVSHNMVTTQFELDGFRVTRTLGILRGIVVRSRSIFRHHRGWPANAARGAALCC